MDLLHRRPRRRRTTGLLATAAGVALVATSVGASGAMAQGNTYTGCLSQGTLFNVAIGSSPFSSCGSAALIRWNQRGEKGAAGAKGQRGRRGAKGDQGAQGPRGEEGARGVPGADLQLRTYSVSATTSGSEAQLLQIAADCDEGDLATGGGFETDGLILASLATGVPSPTGWQAIAEAGESTTALTVTAICADLPPSR
jgi:hypothetical protein